MKILTKENVIGAVAILAFLGVALLFLRPASTEVVATTAPGTGYGYAAGGTQIQTGTVLTNPSPFTYLVATQALEADGILAFNGVSTSTGMLETASVGTCNTASSTIFSVQNPFHSTSTLVYLQLNGVQGATSTDIVVATSTTAAPTTGASTSTLNANILNLSIIPTSTPFSTIAGVTLGNGPRAGQFVNPKGVTGSNSFIPVVVAPNDFVVGMSSSSYIGNFAGGTGAAQVGVPASCVYKMFWRF